MMATYVLPGLPVRNGLHARNWSEEPLVHDDVHVGQSEGDLLHLVVLQEDQQARADSGCGGLNDAPKLCGLHRAILVVQGQAKVSWKLNIVGKSSHSETKIGRLWP